LFSAQTIAVFIFGVALILTMLILALKFPRPTHFQYNIFRITFALASAGVAAVIPGFIDLKISPSSYLLVRAGGALGVFVLVFFFNPAKYKIENVSVDEKWIQVAAVCYRVINGVIEFLLVKTTGGRWTFPKGNIEQNEEKWFAAQREAFEEAGVSGEIEHEPFTTYLHEKKEWKKTGIEIEIYAFLLNVKETHSPEEVHRNPTWFNLKKAINELSAGRRFKYSQEFRRVLISAEKRILSNLKSEA